jgi:hypothetical protein
MNVPNLPPSYGSINSLSDLMHAMNLYKSELQAGVADVKGSGKFVRERLVKVKELKDFSKEANKYIQEAQDKSNLLAKVKDYMFGKIGGKWGAGLDSAANIGGLVGFAAAFLVIAEIKVQEFIQDEEIKVADKERESVSRGFTLFINKQLANNARFARLESNLAKEKILRDKTAADAAYVLKETPKIRELAQAANKKANDSLYETRTNTERFKTQIANIQKFNNDITYEIREGKKQLQTQINDNVRDTNKALEGIQEDTQKSLNGVIADFSKSIIAMNKNAETNYQNSLTVDKKLNQFTGFDFPRLMDSRINAALSPVAASIATTKIDIKKAIDAANLSQQKSNTNEREIKEIQTKLFTGLPEVRAIQKDIADNIKPSIFKEGETRKIWEAKQSTSLESTFKEYFGQQDVAMKKLQQQFDQSVNDNKRLLDKVTPLAFTTIQETPTKLQQLRTDLDLTKQDITKIKQDVDKGNQMNKEGLDRLNAVGLGVAALTPLILKVPGSTADLITPKIPSLGSIKDVTKQASCEVFQPQGCGGKALDELGQGINQNTNQTVGNNVNDLFNKINTGASAAQITLLNIINGKLGAAIPGGGIAGAIKNLFDNKVVDRTLQMFTLITSMHNALMLSNNIGQTLFSAIDNAGGLFGFSFKNEKGESVGIYEQVKEFYGNIIKEIFGASNVAKLTESFSKANRIYQSVTNMMSDVQQLFDSARNLAEMTAGNTGKIGNALKRFGVVGEKAYNYFPEKINSLTANQAKFEKIREGLESIENAVSTLDTITSEVRSIGDNFHEFNTQKDSFVGTLQGKTQEEIDKTAASKLVSKGGEISETDKEADSD